MEGKGIISGTGSGRALHCSNPYDDLVVGIVVIQFVTV
jgi:hypothetical protein